MNELTSYQNQQLPDTLEDLAKFVLIGREKLNAVRAEIRAIKKVGLAKEVHEQKLHEAQEIAEAVLDAEIRIGELTAKIPTTQGQRTDLQPIRNGADKSKRSQLAEIGIKQDTAERFEKLARHPEIVEEAKREARAKGEVISRSQVLSAINANAPKPPKRKDPVIEATIRHEEFEEQRRRNDEYRQYR